MITPCCNGEMSRAEWNENIEEGDCSICGTKIESTEKIVDLETWAQELLDASNDPDANTDNFMTEARNFFEEFLAQEGA